MTLWLAVFRQSKARWGALVGSLLALFIAYQQLDFTLPLWAISSAAVVQAVAILGPVVGATAAWESIRARQAATDEAWRLSTDGGRAAVLQWVSTTLCWGSVALGAVAVAILGPTAIRATWGTPNWVWLLGGLTSVLLQVSVGSLLGFLLPFFFTPILAAVLLYASNVLLQVLGMQHKINMLAPAYFQAQVISFRVNSPLLAMQALWFACLAVLMIALLLALAGARQRSTWIVALVGALTSISAAFGVTLSPGGFYTVTNADWRYSCDRQQPRMCLHPALLVAQADIRGAIEPIISRSAGTPFAASEYDWTSRGILGAPRVGAIAFHLDGTAAGWRAPLRFELAYDLLTPGSQVGSPCEKVSTAHPDSALNGLSSVLTGWLSGQHQVVNVPQNEGEAVTRFFEWSHAKQATWITAHTQSICAGTLKVDDFR